jgi:predicted ATPase/DNA-binding NarL/FixJ family response regulator
MNDESPPPAKDPDLTGVEQPDNSLLRPFTSFIGREQEVAELLDLVEREDVRLITLTGSGGVGKTRLALRVAELVRAGGDEVWFVSLASIRDPGVAPATIADAVGARIDVTLTAEQAVREHMRNRQGLLVLDNLEHVLGVADQVPGLIGDCPRLTILVTSRVPLNLSAEHLYRVRPLTTASETDLPEAVLLFVERTRLRNSALTLDDEHVDDVARICEALDGVPLAIELAAARVASMTPRDILSRVTGSLDLLSGGPRDAPVRQRTLRETIAWSYALLEADQQVLFRRLGVFVGGCTLEAATAVGGTDERSTLDAITALIHASLLDVTLGPRGTSRYAMLDTIRIFALEQLAAEDDERAICQAHARYFMAQAEKALPGYDGPELLETNARIAAELDNARAAIAWAFAAGEQETAVRLTGALWRIWVYPASRAALWFDRIEEGWRYSERAIAASDRLPVAAVTEAYCGGVFFANLRGDIDRAQQIAEEHADRAGAEDEPYARHWAAHNLGIAALARRNMEEAARHFETALAFAPLIRNPENHTAMSLIHLGNISLYRGDPGTASGYLERAGELARICGNPILPVCILQCLGQCRRDLGDYPGAITLLVESHAASQRINDLSGMAAALIALAIIALRLENPRRARRLLEAATRLPCLAEDAAEFEVALAMLEDATGEGLGDATESESLIPGSPEVYQILEEMQAEVQATGPRQEEPTQFPAGLTAREVDVLRLVAAGKSNRAIAEALFISERTVENHISHMLGKLEVESRTAAVAVAAQLGIVALGRHGSPRAPDAMPQGS